MIITESMTVNGKAFIRTCSDSGFLVEREGVRYYEAIDPAELGRTYTETGIPVDPRLSETEEKAKAYDILMGVAE